MKTPQFFWTPDRIVTFHEVLAASMWGYIGVIAILVFAGAAIKAYRWIVRPTPRHCVWCGNEIPEFFSGNACRRCDRWLSNPDNRPV